MNRKVSIVVGTISVFIIIAIFYVLRPTYGNDNDAIKKIISESAIINRPISMIKVIDYEEYRFAGFVDGGQNLGIAIFRKDKNNNYREQSIERRFSSITAFYVPIFKKGVKNIHGVDVIVSNNPNLSKVKRVINDKYIDEKEINGIEMVLLGVDIPELKMQRSFYFYNTDGEQIKQ